MKMEKKRCECEFTGKLCYPCPYFSGEEDCEHQSNSDGMCGHLMDYDQMVGKELYKACEFKNDDMCGVCDSFGDCQEKLMVSHSDFQKVNYLSDQNKKVIEKIKALKPGENLELIVCDDEHFDLMICKKIGGDFFPRIDSEDILGPFKVTIERTYKLMQR